MLILTKKDTKKITIMWPALITGILGLLGGGAAIWGQNKRQQKEFGQENQMVEQQYQNQQGLMDIQQQNQEQLNTQQFQNQQKLNIQGQELQKQTWEETNYPAQVKMLEEAGMNPGLLYGMGGGGGTTTGSQGGGSAQGGSAAGGQAAKGNTPKFQDLGSAMAQANMAADVRLKNAQAEKTEGEANVIEETGIEEAEGKIAKMAAETENTEAKTALTNIDTKIKKIEAANTQIIIDNELDKIIEETRKLKLDNSINAAQQEELKQIIANTALQQEIEIKAKEKGIELTDTQIKKFTNEIIQKYIELDQKQQQININHFNASVNAEYPNIMNVSGGSVVKYLDTIVSVFKGNKGKTHRQTPKNNKY